jgi:hypothetical protein
MQVPEVSAKKKEIGERIYEEK